MFTTTKRKLAGFSVLLLSMAMLSAYIEDLIPNHSGFYFVFAVLVFFSSLGSVACLAGLIGITLEQD